MSLSELTKQSESGGSGSDAYPGEGPQAENEFNFRDFHSPVIDDLNLSMEEPVEKELKFLFANGEFKVSPIEDHQQMAQNAGIRPDYQGPMAVGHINLRGRDALWSVESNIGLQGLVKRMKDFTKAQNWDWGGLVDSTGNPIHDDFLPKKSYWYGWRDGELKLSQHAFSDDCDKIEVKARIAHFDRPPNPFALDGLEEWAQDFGYRIAEYPGGGNANDKIKNKEWIQQYDKGNPEADPGKAFDGEPQGNLTCPYCNETLPNFKAYQMHTKSHQDPELRTIDDGHFPTIRPLDEPLGFGTQSVPTAIPVVGATQQGSWDFAPSDGWRFEAAGGKEGKDLLEAPIPFVYDIERDFITVGHPGMHTHDVMPQGEGSMFTMGGVVEGEYNPGGEMVIRTTTTTPWSSYHMMQLWYYSHPGLEITSLQIENQAGDKHKVASTDVGTYIRSITASDGAAWTASQALKAAGGKVYVVGGAVRDALLQKEPKDIDLMVSGLPPEDVNDILEHLPGRVDLTGKRFGVYRYHTKGQEVEIALPRTDTYEPGGTRGQGQITVDHHLPIEKDLQRRDFTANSMAVDLDSGRLVDPFGGAKDLEAHSLRTTHPDSFDEDPTRLVRALTMHSRHGLVPDEQTRKEMEEHAYRLDQESPDALKQQLEKFLVSANPASGVRLAQETGVLKHLFPELATNFDFDQKSPHHNYTLGEHSANVLDKISQKTKDPDLRLTALLHDTGKPASAWTDPSTGQQHFYPGMIDGQPVGADHARLGADMAEARLRETFNYPVSKIRNIHNLINGHMWPAFSSPKGARKFLNKYGDAADDLLTLREADQEGKGTDVSYKTPVDHMRNLVEQVRQAGDPTSQSAISVDGNDLLSLGCPPGPAVGRVLRNLTDEVVANPASNDRATLLDLAVEYIRAQPEV